MRTIGLILIFAVSTALGYWIGQFYFHWRLQKSLLSEVEEVLSDPEYLKKRSEKKKASIFLKMTPAQKKRLIKFMILFGGFVVIGLLIYNMKKRK